MLPLMNIFWWKSLILSQKTGATVPQTLHVWGSHLAKKRKPNFPQLVPGWYIYLRNSWGTQPPLINLRETLSQGLIGYMLLGRGASWKSSRIFGSTPPPKMQTNKEFNFLSTIQASSSLLLQSALAAAERKTKT